MGGTGATVSNSTNASSFTVGSTVETNFCEGTSSDCTVNLTFVGGVSAENVSHAISEVLSVKPESGPVRWCAEALEEYSRSKEPPAWVATHVIPAVAPVSTNILADMVMGLEQKGLTPEVFVTSCVDFADILKFGTDCPWVEREGTNISYLGLPILRSREIPPGHLLAVAEERQAVLCTITR